MAKGKNPFAAMAKGGGYMGSMKMGDKGKAPAAKKKGGKKSSKKK